MKPLCIDLFCGLGGWSDGFLAEGWDCIGFDIERHDYGTGGYPGQLVLQDVLTLHGSQFKTADCIVSSPPCQEYSYMAMPWSKAKAKEAAYKSGELDTADLTRLFDACFRIQREAIEAAGHFIPLVVENVRGAQKWVGRSRWNYGSFHLWGDVPALMPLTMKGIKVGGIDFNGYGTPGYKAQSFNGTAEKRLREEIKNNGGSWFNVAHNTESGKGKNPVHELAGRKSDGGSWFGDYATMKEGIKQRGSGREWFAGDGKISRMTSSKSAARKAASAMIAKIPFELSRHIARSWRP